MPKLVMPGLVPASTFPVTEQKDADGLDELDMTRNILHYLEAAPIIGPPLFRAAA